MDKYKNLNVKYALVMIPYMMLVVATAGYAYNFLSQSGLSDGMTGIVITLISLCGLVVQTSFGQIIDQSRKLTEKGFISITIAIAIVLAILMAFVNNPAVLTVLVIVGFTASVAGMPFLNSLAFAYEKEGYSINFGVGRGIGSAAYAVGSSLLGSLWGRYGKDVLPIYIAVFGALTLFLVQLMPTPKKEVQVTEKKENMSYRAFFRKYKDIILPVIAMVLLLFCHMLVNTYMAKVIGNIIEPGESVEGYQGTALFIQAMCELPTMFLFGWMMKKLSINKWMIIAAVMYSAKHILILTARNIGMLYTAMVLQMFSYAILIPGSVYFANEVVDASDRNKGQAVMSVTSTVGGLLASLVGGQLYQFMSVTAVLGFGTAASVAGTILMIIGISRIRSDS